MAMKKIYYNEADGDNSCELTIHRNKDGNLYINIDGDNGGLPFHFIAIPESDAINILRDLCDEFGLIGEKLDDGRSVVYFE